MLKAYMICAITKKGGWAEWRFDALAHNAAEAKTTALSDWENDNPNHWGDSHPVCHLFHVMVKALPKGEFPRYLGRWLKTGESKNGTWVEYDPPKFDDEEE